MDNYVLRNFQSADVDKYIKFRLKVQEGLEQSSEPSRESLLHELGRPGYEPRHDLFVALHGGDVVGYMDLHPEAAIKRVILDGEISPLHRRRGLGSGLLDKALGRAVALEAEILHMNIFRSDAGAQTFATNLGFSCVREFIEMERDLGRELPGDIDMPGVAFRPMGAGEEDALADLQNRCFSGTWGFCPNTTGEIVHRLSAPGSSRADVVFASRDQSPVGYCWVKSVAGDTGRVLMLGIEPEHRGRGISRGLLAAGLLHLLERGARRVQLTVDSGNDAACGLYRSAGFRDISRSLWFERRLSP